MFDRLSWLACGRTKQLQSWTAAHGCIYFTRILSVALCGVFVCPVSSLVSWLDVTQRPRRFWEYGLRSLSTYHYIDNVADILYFRGFISYLA